MLYPLGCRSLQEEEYASGHVSLYCLLLDSWNYNLSIFSWYVALYMHTDIPILDNNGTPFQERGVLASVHHGLSLGACGLN